MRSRVPNVPIPPDYLMDKLCAAIRESYDASGSGGPPPWVKFFAFCGDGMYRVAVRCSPHFLDVSIRSVTSDGEEDDGISILFCASSAHRSRIQVERAPHGASSDVFSAVRFGSTVAENAAEEWERCRKARSSR